MTDRKFTQANLFEQADTQKRPKRIRRINEQFFDAPLTPAAAYVLGFIATDGCVTRSNIIITLAARDGEHLSQIASAMGSDAPVSYSKSYPRATLTICSRRLVDALAVLGIRPRKTWTVRPLEAPENLLPHYWRGAIDGDGSWGQKGHLATLSFCGNEWMVEGLAQFFRSTFGVRVGVRSKVNPTGFRFFILAVQRLSAVQAIAQHLYCDATISLPRKLITVSEILATRGVLRDWSRITRGQLLSLYSEHGEWVKVAGVLGLHKSQIMWLRRRLGIERQFRDWKATTLQDLEAAYVLLGSWAAVAEDLGVSSDSLYQCVYKKRLAAKA